MYGRSGLDRFKKSQSLEPFSVIGKSAPASTTQPVTKGISSSSVISSQSSPSIHQLHPQHQPRLPLKTAGPEAGPPAGQTHQVTQVGAGQSTWQPPDWAIEPRSGVYYLEVLKDGEIIDRINLDRRRHIFGRQHNSCDFVLDHQSVSRQHAAVVPHKNGSIYVIDLGSAHGTFVANERLTKDTPVELEAGQSLRFAASTRIYILRKNTAALFSRPPVPAEIDLPPPPDLSDEEAVVAYNTLLNRYGLSKPGLESSPCESGRLLSHQDATPEPERAAKRIRKRRVTFRDQTGGELVEVVGTSDGVDVETEPGPLGVKEGSLVGKYESLVQVTVIPKGKEQNSGEEAGSSTPKGVTDKLQQVLNKIKSAPKRGIYDDLFGESYSSQVGSSWASSDGKPDSPTKDGQGKAPNLSSEKKEKDVIIENDDDNDDLFGD